MLQSVVFDKEFFTKNKAIKWLKNNYYKSDCDTKDNTFRFRQRNPDYLRRIGYKKYRTKKVADGLFFIIAYKTSKLIILVY